MGISLYEQVGGEPIFRRISKVFYDKVYADPWIGQYFKNIPQELIENQQTDFMIAAFGGPDKYAGRNVPDAHEHMHITEELFALRERLLDETFVEVGAPQELVERWKKIDLAFKRHVVKEFSNCKKRFATDEILSFEDPNQYKKAA